MGIYTYNLLYLQKIRVHLRSIPRRRVSSMFHTKYKILSLKLSVSAQCSVWVALLGVLCVAVMGPRSRVPSVIFTALLVQNKTEHKII